MKAKLNWLLSFMQGKWRLALGFCPMCNSDAPELYDCPCCNYYSSASGDPFPPPKYIKDAWWKEYKGAVDMKLKVTRLVAESRNK